MKRQKIRKLILIIALLLLPIIMWYLSPAVIIIGANNGIITGSFIVFMLMLFGTMIFGRLFCGYICPAGGLQECIMIANEKFNSSECIHCGAYIDSCSKKVLCYGFGREERNCGKREKN